MNSESEKSLAEKADAPLWAWLVIALLVLVSVATGLLGSPYLDPIRDVYWAHQIASGQAWPLVGPEIGFFTHLGPLWYYLLAPALLINSSLTSVAAWAGLLQGLQYPLALALGQRLGRWRFGFCLALLLCLPGLTSFSSLSFNHFNLVPAALIGLILAAFHDRARHSAVSAVLVGLCFSLLLHAHPATVAMAWLPALLLLHDRAALLSRAAAMAGGFLIPFLPLLVAVATSGLPDTPTGSVAAHLASHWSWSSALGLPALIWYSLVDGFRHGLILTTQGLPPLAWPLQLAVLLLVLLALTGLLKAWHKPNLRLLLAIAMIGILTQALAALLMRNEVLWYMMLALPTLTMIILAAGLSQLPRWRGLIPATVIGLGSSLTLLSSMLATADDNGRRHFPAAFMMDLMAGGDAGSSHAGPQLSFRGSDRLSRWLCTHPHQLSLHAAVAQQADTLTDLMFELYCPERFPDIQLGGMDEGWQPILALSPALATAFSTPALTRLEALHFYTVSAVQHPRSGVALAHAGNYPPRERSLADENNRSITFEAEPEDWLVFSNPYPWWAEIRILEVEANGHPMDKLGADTVSQLFHCQPCRADPAVTWQVSFRSPPGLQPDMVLISP